MQSESSLLLVFLRDHFPQGAGVHPVPPPSTVFWYWSVSVHTVLFLILILAWSFFLFFFFLSSGRTFFFSLLATRLMPSVLCSLWGIRLQIFLLFSLFVNQLIPSFLFGLFVPAAAALEASILSWSAPVSHFVWVIFWVARFVRLKPFAPAASSLFLTLVPSLRRALSSGFPVCIPLSSFQRRLFFLLLLHPCLPVWPSVRWLRLLQWVPPFASSKLMSLDSCWTFSPLFFSVVGGTVSSSELLTKRSPWWLFPPARLVLVLAFSLPMVLLLGGIRLATVAVILVLRLVARAVVP